MDQQRSHQERGGRRERLAHRGQDWLEVAHEARVARREFAQVPALGDEAPVGGGVRAPRLDDDRRRAGRAGIEVRTRLDR